MTSVTNMTTYTSSALCLIFLHGFHLAYALARSKTLEAELLVDASRTRKRECITERLLNSKRRSYLMETETLPAADRLIDCIDKSSPLSATVREKIMRLVPMAIRAADGSVSKFRYRS